MRQFQEEGMCIWKHEGVITMTFNTKTPRGHPARGRQGQTVEGLHAKLGAYPVYSEDPEKEDLPSQFSKGIKADSMGGVAL